MTARRRLVDDERPRIDQGYLGYLRADDALYSGQHQKGTKHKANANEPGVRQQQQPSILLHRVHYPYFEARRGPSRRWQRRQPAAPRAPLAVCRSAAASPVRRRSGHHREPYRLADRCIGQAIDAGLPASVWRPAVRAGGRWAVSTCPCCLTNVKIAYIRQRMLSTGAKPLLSQRATVKSVAYSPVGRSLSLFGSRWRAGAAAAATAARYPPRITILLAMTQGKHPLGASRTAQGR